MAMKHRSDEDKLCMAFKKHLSIYFPMQIGKLVYTHIANQGRSPQEGDKLKKMGVMAGWYDYIFVAHPSPWKTIHLEAKVVGRNYSDSQEKFDYLTKGMPVFKDKFYSVREGHEKLIAAGVPPLMDCRLFHEPDYLSIHEKYKLALAAYAPYKPRKP